MNENNSNSNLHRYVLRLAVVATVVVAVLASSVLFGSLPPAPESGVPPGTDELVTEYDMYVGTKVLTAGPVLSTDPIRIRVKSNYGETMVLRVEGVDRSVSPGDHLTIYGVLKEGNRITAVDTVRKPGWAYLLTRVISFVAGLWVLGRALLHWQFDASQFVFALRPNPSGVRSFVSLSGRDQAEEDRDA